MKRTGTALALAVLLAAGGARGVETAYYGDTSGQDFSAGEKDNVYVDEEGNVVLGPLRETLVEGVDYVWCVAAGPEGTLYAGTVPGGKIYRAAQGKSEVYFDTGAAGVFSMAVQADGAVVAGTGSPAKVFRITAGGQGGVIAEPDAQYIFGLAVAKDGSLLAATGGTSGRIYRIREGAVEQVYQSPSQHLTSVVAGPDGTIYASSGDRGAVYRIGADGSGTVLFSAPQRVVQDIALGADGSVYAVTAGVAEEKAGAEEEAVKSILAEVQARRQDTGANPTPPAPPAKRTYKVVNALYRIYPDDRVQAVFTVSGALMLSVLPMGDRVICSTGGQASILRIDPETRRAARIFESKGEHILDLAADGKGGFYAGCGMPGQAMHFSNERSRTGSFTSRVLEARGLTRWGKLAWTGEAPTASAVTFGVRCGNSPSVDSTWTDWRSVDAGTGTGETQLPPSRYVQYRMGFATAAPDVTARIGEVSIAGLPLNAPPVVMEIGAGKEPAGQAAGAQQQAQRETAEAQKAAQQKGADHSTVSGSATVYWKADDPNGDRLSYTVEVKESSMAGFIKLGEELTDQRFTWDTTALPDGKYLIRVTASDKLSNPPGTELSGSREEGPVTVDNTPPLLSVGRVAKTESGFSVEAEAKDGASQIAGVSYSVDGGKWQAAAAADGIFDSQSERVNISVPKGEAAVVVIRSTDRAGNTGAVIANLK